MFVLREVSGRDSGVSNMALGDRYHLIHSESETKVFRDTFERFWKDVMGPEEEQNTFAFIVCKDGELVIPLYKNGFYYVMTGRGDTFERISYRQ